MNALASEIAPTPGHRVVAYVGGPKAAARLAGRSVKSVYRWLQPTGEGGGGGLFPMPAQRRMVANAHAEGLPLIHADFAPKPGEGVL